MSSSLPTKGLTYVAPAFAARRAWLGEKTRVTFVLMPIPESLFTALSPSLIIGIFITIFSWICERDWASLTISSAFMLTASALTGPLTIEQISFNKATGSLPSFAIRDGFVVAPSITPSSHAFLISSTFAVSIKNFITPPFLADKIYIILYEKLI